MWIGHKRMGLQDNFIRVSTDTGFIAARTYEIELHSEGS